MDSILDFGFSHSGIGVAQKALKNCLRINHWTYNNIVGCGICAKSTLSMKLIWDISTSFSLKILNWTKEYLVEYSFEWKVQCTYLCSNVLLGEISCLEWKNWFQKWHALLRYGIYLTIRVWSCRSSCPCMGWGDRKNQKAIWKYNSEESKHIFMLINTTTVCTTV